MELAQIENAAICDCWPRKKGSFEKAHLVEILELV